MEGYVIINGNIYKNMTSSRGITVLIQRLFTDTDVAPFTYISIGIGATPVDSNDSAMEYELSRQKATYNHIPGSSSVVLSATFPKGEVEGLISEVGIFNKAYSGDMFARALISPPKWKERGKSLPIAWKFSL